MFLGIFDAAKPKYDTSVIRNLGLIHSVSGFQHFRLSHALLNVRKHLVTSGFVPYYSGLKNLELLAAINRRVSKEWLNACMEQIGLGDAKNKRVSKYSMGMRQRLGIAQAIMENPRLLILDEPLNGLDEQGVEDIRALLLELKSQGKTILLSSHNREDIDLLCDSVCKMEGGVLTRL